MRIAKIISEAHLSFLLPEFLGSGCGRNGGCQRWEKGPKAFSPRSEKPFVGYSLFRLKERDCLTGGCQGMPGDTGQDQQQSQQRNSRAAGLPSSPSAALTLIWGSTTHCRPFLGTPFRTLGTSQARAPRFAGKESWGASPCGCLRPIPGPQASMLTPASALTSGLTMPQNELLDSTG